MIYSGNWAYKLLKTPSNRDIKLNSNPYKDRCSVSEDFPNWHGTAVGIDISIDKSQDFEELLNLIREVYRLDVRGRRKRRFKKAKFI